MDNLKFEGLGVALITPFNEKQHIDYNSLEKLISSLSTKGTDFLVAMGTTSEAATLSDKEKNDIVSFIKEKNTKDLPLVIGLGGNSTKAVIDTINKTNFSGISAILSVVPFYNKPEQKGMYEHFKAIGEASPVPVIVYNVPGRTSSCIEADTVLRLAHDIPSIQAIKEASGDLNLATHIMKNKPKGFKAFSGDDGLTLPLLSLGFDGVISVVGNAFPSEFSQMVKLAKNNLFHKAREIHMDLNEIIDYLFIEGNPAGVKSFLELQGICKNQLRLPLTRVSHATSQKIKALNEQFQEKYSLVN